VGDARRAAGVSVGSNDLVQPGTGEAVRDGDTIVVRTSKPYTVTVDGQTRTLWTTATSADGILADAAPLGSTVALAADRSASRDELTPLVSRPRNIFVSADGPTPEDRIRAIAAHAGKILNDPTFADRFQLKSLCIAVKTSCRHSRRFPYAASARLIAYIISCALYS